MPRLMSISRPSSCATRSRANRLLEAIDVFSTVVADKSATLNARPTGFLRPPRHPDPPDYVGAQTGRPIEGGLNTVAACKSADQRDPFLGCRFGCGSRLCRKLEHCCFLICKQVS